MAGDQIGKNHRTDARLDIYGIRRIMRHIFRDPSEELHRRVLEDLGGAAGPLPALPPAASLLQLRGQSPGHLTIILHINSFNIVLLIIICDHLKKIATLHCLFRLVKL